MSQVKSDMWWVAQGQTLAELYDRMNIGRLMIDFNLSTDHILSKLFDSLGRSPSIKSLMNDLDLLLVIDKKNQSVRGVKIEFVCLYPHRNPEYKKRRYPPLTQTKKNQKEGFLKNMEKRFLLEFIDDFKNFIDYLLIDCFIERIFPEKASQMENDLKKILQKLEMIELKIHSLI